MKNIFFPVFLSFFCLVCTAQNFQPGYIIDQAGDTITGRIKYMNWSVNPTSVFIERHNGQVSEYHTRQIRLFEITGAARYVKAEVKRSLRPVDHELLHKPFRDIEISDTVLLKAIVEGAWNLYELNTDKKQYFLKTESGDYEELQYRIALSETSSNDFYTQHIYRDQLFEKLSSHPAAEAFKTELVRVRYKNHDLKNFIEKYNKTVSGTKNKLHFRRERTGNFFAGAGITVGYMRVRGNYPDVTSVKFGTSFSPSISAGYDIRLSTDQQRLKIRFELGYFGLAFNGKGHIEESVQVRERDIIYNLRVNNFYTGAGALYNVIQKNKLKLYAGALVALNFSGYPTNRHEVKFNGNGNDKISDPYLTYKSTWAAANLKLGGFVGDKFELAFSWPVTGSFSDYSFYLVPKPTTLQLNYHFR